MLRVAVVLLTTLVVLLTVVILRVETARMHNRIAELDTDALEIWQQIRSQDVELARLRNPMLIRQRVAELRLGEPLANPRPPGGSSRGD